MSDKKKCPFCEAIALQRFIEEHHSKPAGFGMALSAALVSYAVVNGRKCGRTTDYMKDGKGYIAFVRNRDKDKESNVKHDATVLTEIGYIKANTDEIKAEQKEQRKTNTEFVTRLTDVEASAKQAHKRLDHIEKRMDQAE